MVRGAVSIPPKIKTDTQAHFEAILKTLKKAKLRTMNFEFELQFDFSNLEVFRAPCSMGLKIGKHKEMKKLKNETKIPLPEKNEYIL